MTDEAVFPYFNQLTNERVRLYLGAITDVYVLLNFNKRADKDVTTNFTPIKVDWVDNSHAIAKIDVYDPSFFNFGLVQNVPPSLQCFGRNRK